MQGFCLKLVLVAQQIVIATTVASSGAVACVILIGSYDFIYVTTRVCNVVARASLQKMQLTAARRAQRMS